MLDNNGAHIADSLPYKDEEIRRDYRGAKNKPEQVKILADLNDCGTNEIRQVLGMKTIGRKPGAADLTKRKSPTRKKNKLPGAIEKLVEMRLEELDEAIKELEAERDELLAALGEEEEDE